MDNERETRSPEELARIDQEAADALIKVDPFLLAASQPGAAEVVGGRFPRAPRSVAREGWPFKSPKVEIPKPKPVRRGMPW